MADDTCDSDEESVDSKIVNIQKDVHSENESESDEILKTVFDEPELAEIKSSAFKEVHKEVLKEEQSEDSFNIYVMLNKKKPEKSVARKSKGELQYPSRFTSCDRSKVSSNLDQNSLGAEIRRMNFQVRKLVLCPSVGNSDRWKGDVIIMGDFNKVHSEDERYSSLFNAHGATAFNSFISACGLVEVPSGDYGPTPFRFFHNWFDLEGFDSFVVDTWRGINITESNALLKMVKNLKLLKGHIHVWVKGKKDNALNLKKDLKNKLFAIDSSIDKGKSSSASLEERMAIMNNLSSLEKMESIESSQKDKVKWSIESDGNSKFFHGIINKRRNNLAIRALSLMGNGLRILLPLSPEQAQDLERLFSKEEVKGAFWDYGLDKSPAKKKQTMIFKVNIEKAFDSVWWDFLDDFLKKFGFGSRWRDWIQSCIKSSRGSILINGSPTSRFHFFKRLKQGDPLSPLLFILVMKSFHLSFQNVVNAGLFKGVALDTSLQLSHLFYADNVVFIGQWCDSNFSTIIRVLDCFFRASGLRINLHKSKLTGIAFENSLVNFFANSIGCMTINLPISYLGVNIGGHMSRINSWNVVINKILSRLSKWKMKALSIGGRLTLLKSVLGSMPINYMSMFKAPIHEKGGLGVSSFYALNRALIFKWVWRFRAQSNSFWSRVIKALHDDDGIELLGSIKKKVGNGEILCSGKNIGREMRLSKIYFLEYMPGLILSNMLDRWSWSLSGDGEFFVSSTRNLIDDKTLRTVGSKTQCCKYVSLKVNIFYWRVKLNNLPTRLNLSRRDLYKSIARWWDVNMMELSSYEDWWFWLSSLSSFVQAGDAFGRRFLHHLVVGLELPQ
nr:RNA-directed DNA polymerase, eukaryota [Tanacetum cinerariifolium]